MAIKYYTKINQKINDKYNNPIKYINDEKSKFQLTTTKIEKYQIDLEKIENYKTQGTIISKEKIILNEEKPTKYFFIQEKKINKKHITCLQNEQGKLLTAN